MDSINVDVAMFLHPMDIIKFLIDSSGRTTNTLLVKQFSDYLQGGDDMALTNKKILKSVTGHVATLRRQGSRVSQGEFGEFGGKIILLKNKFRGKSPEDIWSSLILTLPREEIKTLTPMIDYDEANSDVMMVTDHEQNQVDNCENVDEVGGITNNVPRKSEEIKEVTKKADCIEQEKLEGDSDSKKVKSEEIGEATEKLDGKEEERLDGDSDPDFIETSQYDMFNRRTDLENEDVKENFSINILPPDEDSTLNHSKVENFDKSKTVKDLTKNFNEIASTSSVSLVDLLEKKPPKSPVAKKRARRPQSSSFTPLTKEGRAWLKAAMRCDYQTLARLARSHEDIVFVRDPATGYTGLHWAAKHGNTDIVKLLAGTYELDINVKTRGGYTPLHLAGLGHKTEVYDLMVNSYNADESIRDYSGRKPGHYLDLKYLPIPGAPPRIELTEDVDDESVDDVDSVDRSRKHRHQVKRSVTHAHQFLKEFRDSMRDVRGSLKDSLLRPRSGTQSGLDF